MVALLRLFDELQVPPRALGRRERRPVDRWSIGFALVAAPVGEATCVSFTALRNPASKGQRARAHCFEADRVDICRSRSLTPHRRRSNSRVATSVAIIGAIRRTKRRRQSRRRHERRRRWSHVPSTGFLKAVSSRTGRPLLARRRAQPDAPAHLRDGVPDAEALEEHPELIERGESSATIASSGKSSSSSCSTRSPGDAVFLPRGAFRLQRMVDLRAASLRAGRIRRGDHAPGLHRSSSGRAGTRPHTTTTCTGCGPRTSSRSTPTPRRPC